MNGILTVDLPGLRPKHSVGEPAQPRRLNHLELLATYLGYPIANCDCLEHHLLAVNSSALVDMDDLELCDTHPSDCYWWRTSRSHGPSSWALFARYFPDLGSYRGHYWDYLRHLLHFLNCSSCR